MTAYKTFFKIVKSYKFMIILYSIMLIFFTGFNMQSSDTNSNFIANKPDIFIVNNDSDNKFTNNLVKYLKSNTNIIKLKNNQINDALFYRDIDYIIYIPKNYYSNYLKGLRPIINVKSTNTYQSSLAESILNRYIKVINVYQKDNLSEDDLIKIINDSLNNNTKITVTSKLDTTSLNKMAFYYNFLNYTILAGCVYVICLIISSYKKETIRKRITVSSTNYKTINKQLFIGNSILILGLWLIYNILALILMGESIISLHGLLYIINSLVFTLCALTIAFLIGNLINNKDAINGIINVVALGSSFLCGAFVPASVLPKSVLSIAHILPSYWYINSNDLIKNIEVINMHTLKPVLNNMFVIIVFSIIFILASNIVSRKNRKID